MSLWGWWFSEKNPIYRGGQRVGQRAYETGYSTGRLITGQTPPPSYPGGEYQDKTPAEEYAEHYTPSSGGGVAGRGAGARTGETESERKHREQQEEQQRREEERRRNVMAIPTVGGVPGISSGLFLGIEGGKVVIQRLGDIVFGTSEASRALPAMVSEYNIGVEALGETQETHETKWSSYTQGGVFKTPEQSAFEEKWGGKIEYIPPITGEPGYDEFMKAWRAGTTPTEGVYQFIGTPEEFGEYQREREQVKAIGEARFAEYSQEYATLSTQHEALKWEFHDILITQQASGEAYRERLFGLPTKFGMLESSISYSPLFQQMELSRIKIERDLPWVQATLYPKGMPALVSVSTERTMGQLGGWTKKPLTAATWFGATAALTAATPYLRGIGIATKLAPAGLGGILPEVTRHIPKIVGIGMGTAYGASTAYRIYEMPAGERARMWGMIESTEMIPMMAGLFAGPAVKKMGTAAYEWNKSVMEARPGKAYTFGVSQRIPELKLPEPWTSGIIGEPPKVTMFKPPAAESAQAFTSGIAQREMIEGAMPFRSSYQSLMGPPFRGRVYMPPEMMTSGIIGKPPKPPIPDISIYEPLTSGIAKIEIIEGAQPYITSHRGMGIPFRKYTYGLPPEMMTSGVVRKPPAAEPPGAFTSGIGGRELVEGAFPLRSTYQGVGLPIRERLFLPPEMTTSGVMGKPPGAPVPDISLYEPLTSGITKAEMIEGAQPYISSHHGAGIPFRRFTYGLPPEMKISGVIGKPPAIEPPGIFTSGIGGKELSEGAFPLRSSYQGIGTPMREHLFLPPEMMTSGVMGKAPKQQKVIKGILPSGEKIKIEFLSPKKTKLSPQVDIKTAGRQVLIQETKLEEELKLSEMMVSGIEGQPPKLAPKVMKPLPKEKMPDFATFKPPRRMYFLEEMDELVAPSKIRMERGIKYPTFRKMEYESSFRPVLAAEPRIRMATQMPTQIQPQIRQMLEQKEERHAVLFPIITPKVDMSLKPLVSTEMVSKTKMERAAIPKLPTIQIAREVAIPKMTTEFKPVQAAISIITPIPVPIVTPPPPPPPPIIILPFGEGKYERKKKKPKRKQWEWKETWQVPTPGQLIGNVPGVIKAGPGIPTVSQAQMLNRLPKNIYKRRGY